MHGFRQKLLSIGIVLVLFVIFILYSAPASLIKPALGMWFPQLVLANSAGTIWHGTATQAWFSHAGKSAALGELEWRLSPISILLLHPQLELQTRAASQALNARVSASPMGKVTVSELQANFPLSILRPWYPLLLEGEVSVNLEDLVYRGNWVQQLEGSAELTSAQWKMGRDPVLLGNYQAQLAMEGEEVLVRLSDQDANLGVNGTLQLAQSGDYQTDLFFEERAATVAPIFQFLSFIAQANDGGLVLNTRGNLNGRAANR